MKAESKIDELIDAHGDLRLAIESRKDLIARRSAEGKQSPNAESQLAELLALPYNYVTPGQAKRDAANAEYIRNTSGVD